MSIQISERSTPIKPKNKSASSKVAGMAYGKPDHAKEIHKYLQAEVGPYQHHNIDILDFAEHILGLDRSIGQQILDMDLTLDPLELIRYRRLPKEADLHQPFKQFSQTLLRKVVSGLGISPDVLTDELWDGGGNKVIVHDGRARKPDMLSIARSQLPLDGKLPQWTFVKHVLEFKHNTYRDRFTLPALSAPQKERIKDSFRTNAERGPGDPSQERPKPTARSDINSLKRQREPTSEEDLESKKPRFEEKKAQLGTYAIECLGATSRRWVTGGLVDTCVVTPCYFDRFMVGCASSFRFDEEPSKLALMLYAMELCSKDRAGFDPHLISELPALTPPAVGDVGQPSSESLPVRNLIGSYFYFPEDATANLDAGTSQDTAALEGQQVPSSNMTADDAPKGETSAIMALSEGTSGCFRVDGVLRTPDDLISRGTQVYKVKRRLPNNKFSRESYVLKLSWPLKSRTPEADSVKHLKSVIPASARDHLPHIVFTKIWTAQQLGLPWLELKLSLNADNHQERVLAILAATYYKKLWEAGSAENFKQVWLDCVEFHFLAFKMGKVLHRDLSESNLMVLPVDGGKAKGVLNDWDMAKFVYDQGDGLLAGHHRTGTPPFMAIDLLPQAETSALPVDESNSDDDDEDSRDSRDGEGDSEGDSGTHKSEDKEKADQSAHPHWLRHDLESMFYILVWAALHYNLKKGTRDTETHRLVESWVLASNVNAMAKRSMLSPIHNYPELLNKSLKRDFRKSDLGQWIESLRQLFTNARLSYDFAVQAGEECADSSTYGGRLTFKKFMQAINVTPRTWGIEAYLEDED